MSPGPSGANRTSQAAASLGLRGSLAAVALTVLGCSPGFEPAFRETAPPGLLDDVAIADPDEALTFARTGEGDGRRVIAVREHRGGVVRGVDLSLALGRPVADPIDAVNELGYEGLRAAIAGAAASAAVEIPAARLGIPVDLRDHHVAAATNFPEHADDAGAEKPFLFAKLVRPTGPWDPVSAGDGLLDYEVEVAWVTLAPLASGESPAQLGLVLCNDFTDRDTLMRHIDPWDIESGAGFATGKSFPGFLPVGSLFVVPRDPRGFAAGLELRLFVNGALRQRSSASEMIWDLDEIVRRTFAWKDRRWEHRGDRVGLLGGGGGAIPERTLILSGTPRGTVFAGLRARDYVAGAGAWVLGGFRRPAPSHVVDAYVRHAGAAGAYLQPGDRVEIHVDRLGMLRNEIAP